MTLNRREMLRLGGYAGAGIILSTAASSSVLPSLVMPPAADPLAPITPQPAAPVAAQVATPTAPGGIDPQLFARAKAALDQHQIYARDSMGIVDFSKPSSEPRFHVVNLASGDVQS